MQEKILPKRALDLLSWDSASNLKNNYNLILDFCGTIRTNRKILVMMNKQRRKLEATMNLFESEERIRKSQYSPKNWIKFIS